ncbi:MAG: 50S ribosomal protein L25 [Planctomycetota bacterium]|nr:MAG: 50S ribosomal protein L25 [Planctomycetota bacterium]
MAEVYTLEAALRDQLGSAHSRRLRRAGRVPAVLYGKKQDNLHLSLDAARFADALRHHTRILAVALPDGRTEQAVIKEVQWDELTDQVLHVDLARVDLKERIEVEVDLRFVGESRGVAQGGTLEVQLHALTIECEAGAIPDEIRVDVSGLGLDEELRVRDLVLPPGVEVLHEADELVCSVSPPRAAEEEEAAAAATPPQAAGAEPELITRPKREEEED